MTLQQLLSQLNDLSHQYRVVNKRLLVRFKDRNPAPLGGLDILLKETYSSIVALSDSVEETKQLVYRKGLLLESLCRGIAMLSALKFGLSSEERSMLESHLCPNISEGTEQGWEETVEASLTYLLKTCLAKAVKVCITSCLYYNIVVL
jgi:Bardet-Biedl syndrome 9 protein